MTLYAQQHKPNLQLLPKKERIAASREKSLQVAKLTWPCVKKYVHGLYLIPLEDHKHRACEVLDMESGIDAIYTYHRGIWGTSALSYRTHFVTCVYGEHFTLREIEFERRKRDLFDAVYHKNVPQWHVEIFLSAVDGAVLMIGIVKMIDLVRFFDNGGGSKRSYPDGNTYLATSYGLLNYQGVKFTVAFKAEIDADLSTAIDKAA